MSGTGNFNFGNNFRSVGNIKPRKTVKYYDITDTRRYTSEIADNLRAYEADPDYIRRLSDEFQSIDGIDKLNKEYLAAAIYFVETNKGNQEYADPTPANFNIASMEKILTNIGYDPDESCGNTKKLIVLLTYIQKVNIFRRGGKV